MNPRRIRYRLLAVVLAVPALVVGLTFLVHAVQEPRLARKLRDQADRAEADGRLDRAARCLERYLVFAPNDNAARARCGELLERTAVNDHQRWRAVTAYEAVLSREPSRRDVRRRLALLTMRLGWTVEARANLEILLREEPGQADLQCLLGRCQEAAGDYTAAAASYRGAFGDAPGLVEAYVRLADLLARRLDQPEAAGRVLDELVKNNPGSAEAYLARSVHHLQHAELKEAGRDLGRARELAPADARVLLACAELARRQGRLDEARHFLEHGRDAAPDQAALHLALAGLELQRGRGRDAVACLRQGLQSVPHQPQLMQLLGETLIELDDGPAAEETIRRLHHPGAPAGLAHYLNGRLHMRRHDWPAAARTLEEVMRSPDSAPALAGRAGFFLARCHERLGDPAHRLAALQESVRLDGSSATARLELAEALRRAGRLDEAMGQYHEVVRLPQAPEESWLLLGRLLVQRNRALPPRKRAWAEVEKVIERAYRLPALAAPLALLRAEVLREQGRTAEARDLLEKAAADHPDRAELWTALAEQAWQQGEPERGAAVLEDARRRLGDRAELCEARIALCLAQPDGEAGAALRKVEADLSSAPAADRPRLLGLLASAYLQAGEPAEARRVCRLLAGAAPADLPSRVALLELALQAGEESLLAPLAADVRRLEGEEDVWWRYGEAVRLLAAARRGEPGARERLRPVVAEILARRPGWPRGALVRAWLAELDGDSETAAGAYLRAFQGGEQRPGLAEHLARLLIEQGRLDEADDVVRAVQQRGRPSAELARLGAETALRQHAGERAVELARLAVPHEPASWADLVWLGQVYAQAGRPAEAEELLRQAVRRRGDVAETWLALVAHLARPELAEEAEEVRGRMQRALPPDQRPLAMALSAELLGRWKEAERCYRAALAADPHDPVVLLRGARFHVRLGRAAQAEPLLRRLLAPAADVPDDARAWARRQLALLLAFRGDEAGYRQALALLGRRPAPGADGLLDRRARLLVGGTRPDARRDSLRALEESARKQPLNAEELFYLARLHEAEGDTESARERMLDLLALDRNNPTYLRRHVELLLRAERTEEARPWALRLRNAEKD